MKFIISEHRLDKLINKFIDEYIKDKFDRYQNESQITYSVIEEREDADYYTIFVGYTNHDGGLYIEDYFVDLITNMFGISPIESMNKIHEWFERYEGIRAKYLEGYYKGEKYIVKL